ncbi:hypothetical protein [Maricaulis sp.]|uniref:hypothetical protein n=1 Tax=Maricaulis sp. TaxID=1486257 RepID=UPI00263802C5|nr:hypothetical protein [Maricaulis sp.]
MSDRQFDLGSGIFWFFKRFGDNPAGALWISLWQMLVGGAIIALMLAFLFPAHKELIAAVVELENGSVSDEEAAMVILSSVFGVLASVSWGIILAILASLSFQGAWMRFLTQRPMAAVIPLRLGGDEFRLLGVNLLYFVVAIAMYFGVIMVMVTFGVAGGGMLAASGDNTFAGGLGFGLIMFFGFVAIALSVLFVAVKLSVAPALTVHDRKFRFFESWEATDRVFFPTLLSYFVVLVLSVIIGGVISFVLELSFLGAMMPVIEEFTYLGHGAEPTVEEVFATLQNALSDPAVYVPLLIGGTLMYLLQIVLEGFWHGVGAYNAVRHRAGGEAPEEDAPVLGADHPAGASPSEG